MLSGGRQMHDGRFSYLIFRGAGLLKRAAWRFAGQKEEIEELVTFVLIGWAATTKTQICGPLMSQHTVIRCEWWGAER